MTKEMSDDELVNYLNQEIKDAELYTTPIQNERTTALDYYNSEPMGNEIDGRSQVVTSDVMDTVEWMLPMILEMFVESGKVCDFEPNNPQDAEQAEQESNYCHYVLYRQNLGFLILYTWFKDALLQKNGVIKCFWDEVVEEERETYENVSDEEFLLVAQDPEVDIVEHTATPIELPEETQALINQAVAEGMPAPQIPTTHEFVAVRKSNVKQVKIINIPPENFYVKRTHNSLDLSDCDFCAHTEERTCGDLIADGYDEDLVYSIPDYQDEQLSNERYTRYKDEGGWLNDDNTATDKTQRKVLVHECYVKMDYDGDGKQEYRKITLAGGKEGRVILDNELADSNPFIATTPIINTHKFYGKSIADITMEIQKIRTALMRGFLDNTYAVNNPRHKIVKGQVNIDDLLTQRMDGIVRMNSLQAHDYMVTPSIAGSILPAFEFLDRWREERTGVSDQTQGLDPHSLKDQSIYGMSKIMSAAQTKIKMVARIMAETGFAKLIQRIHELTRKYEKNQCIAEVNGEYITVDPRAWRKRRNMRILVGLGNNTNEVKLGAVQQLLTMQQTIATNMGMKADSFVTQENIYNTLSDFVKLSGLQSVGKYFNKPQPTPPAPKEPSEIEKATAIEAEAKVKQSQIKAQTDLTIKSQELAAKKEKDQKDFEVKRAKLNQDMAIAEKDIELKYGDQMLKAADQLER
jgi:hypothetical protein